MLHIVRNAPTLTEMTYSEAIRERMKGSTNALGRPITLRQLATHLGRSYEHCRKIVSGEPSISEEMNRDLCRVLHLDPSEMWTVAQREKVARRYPSFAPGTPPKGELAQLWPLLTPRQKTALLGLVRSMVAAPKATEADSGGMLDKDATCRPLDAHRGVR
jgi:hypothetical protein